jgi:hypothetical protein
VCAAAEEERSSSLLKEVRKRVLWEGGGDGK